MAFFRVSSKQKVNILTNQYGTSCRRSERYYHTKSNTMVLFNNYGFWRCSSVHPTIPGNLYQTRCRRLLNVCLPGSFSCQHTEDIILVKMIGIILVKTILQFVQI